MNNLQIFKFEENNVRTVDVDGKVFFVAKDVATLLGYKDTINAIKQHCRGVAKHHLPHPQSATKTIEVNVITEGDIYRLVANSKLPKAGLFEKWVFDEVLPSIRKHGAYMTPEKVQEALVNPDTMIMILTQLKEEQEEKRLLTEKIAEDEPYTKFGYAIANTDDEMLVSDYSHILANAGIKMGPIQLMEWLRTHKYISSNAFKKNKPFSQYVEMDVLRTRIHKRTKKNGDEYVTYTPLITGKGQKYFYERILAEQKLLGA